MRDVSELLVLHTLRLTGVVQFDVLLGRLAMDPVELRALLDSYRADDLVTHHEGTLPGWALTTRGRSRGEELLADDLDGLGARGSVEAGYLRFLELNGPVLQICTDWQVVADTDPKQLNGHDDPDYDRQVLERLGTLHLVALDVLSGLALGVERFGGYGDRLGNALASARDGGVDWVTKPVIDSYHTVWFELHEDLLATLGRRRGDEVAGRRTGLGEHR